MAARNNVALFDLSSYTKMYLAGPDAEEAVDWLFTADLGREPGSVVYTCSLNSRGGVEADVIVIPLEEGAGTLVGPILKVRQRPNVAVLFIKITQINSELFGTVSSVKTVGTQLFSKI